MHVKRQSMVVRLRFILRFQDRFQDRKEKMKNTIESASPHVLPSLPYAEAALAPVISAHTIGFHYGKHHKGYVDNMNKLIAGTEFANLPLEKIITAPAGTRQTRADQQLSDWWRGSCGKRKLHSERDLHADVRMKLQHRR